MFKLSSYALTAALFTHTIGNVNAACSEGIISTTSSGDCNYAAFIIGAELKGCTKEEADAIIDGLLTAQEVADGVTKESYIEALCTYDAPTQFVEIQGTYQKDRRYFSGGGQFVDGENWDVDAGRVQRFETNLASSTLIAFPQYAARIEYNGGTNGYPANMNLETSCDLNTVMCCFTDDTKMEKSFGDNFDETTDVCHHDLHDSPQSSHIKEGWSVFPGSETSTHCVGFTWDNGDDELIGNMMYEISLHNTITKGYRAGVPGSPMCGCVEHMPVVEKASCRTATKTGEITFEFTYDAVEGLSASNTGATINYQDCPEPDLAAQYKANNANNPDDAALIDEHLVGEGGCADEVVEYLNEEQFLIEGQDPRYITPDAAKWEIVVGEGIHFLPPNIDPIQSDTDFRDLINGGCTESDGTTPRACIIRRHCSSCSAESHRDIFYKRLTDLPPMGTATTGEGQQATMVTAEGEVYFLEMFMNTWSEFPNNTMGVDFELYSSYADALAGDNAWTYCNYYYPHHSVGFPHNCGPTGAVHNQYNSYKNNHATANHHAWYVEKA